MILRGKKPSENKKMASSLCSTCCIFFVTFVFRLYFFGNTKRYTKCTKKLLYEFFEIFFSQLLKIKK